MRTPRADDVVVTQVRSRASSSCPVLTASHDAHQTDGLIIASPTRARADALQPAPLVHPQVDGITYKDCAHTLTTAGWRRLERIRISADHDEQSEVFGPSTAIAMPLKTTPSHGCRADRSLRMISASSRGYFEVWRGS